MNEQKKIDGELGPISTMTGVVFEIGDYVEKFTGEAQWFGWVVARYNTRRGKLRYVIDIDPQGFQMIAIPKQLRKADDVEFNGTTQEV